MKREVRLAPGYILNTRCGWLRVGEEQVWLTTSEAALLAILVTPPRVFLLYELRILLKEQLHRAHQPSEAAVHGIIARTKMKLKGCEPPAGLRRRSICYRPGVGYSFDEVRSATTGAEVASAGGGDHPHRPPSR